MLAILLIKLCRLSKQMGIRSCLSKNNARVASLTELHRLKGVLGTVLLGAACGVAVYALYLEAEDAGSMPGEVVFFLKKKQHVIYIYRYNVTKKIKNIEHH